MREAIIILIFSFASCATKVDISGIIVDNRSHQPVQGVKVSTIVDIVNNEVKMVEPISSSDGIFQIQFDTYRTLANTIPVELCKKPPSDKINNEPCIFSQQRHLADEAQNTATSPIL